MSDNASIYNLRTSSVDQTMELGAVLGKLVFPGAILALSGDLGAGKTYFIKGLARGLGVRDTDEVASPSFALLHVYDGRMPLYHFDLYRLIGYNDFLDIGGEDYLGGTGVAAIEWADKIIGFLPEQLLQIEIDYENDVGRRLTFQAKGDLHRSLLAGFMKDV